MDFIWPMKKYSICCKYARDIGIFWRSIGSKYKFASLIFHVPLSFNFIPNIHNLRAYPLGSSSSIPWPCVKANVTHLAIQENTGTSLAPGPMEYDSMLLPNVEKRRGVFNNVLSWDCRRYAGVHSLEKPAQLRQATSVMTIKVSLCVSVHPVLSSHILCTPFCRLPPLEESGLKAEASALRKSITTDDRNNGASGLAIVRPLSFLSYLMLVDLKFKTKSVLVHDGEA